ncbi:MAG: hypothetical protein H0T76_10135 [Nannocystis sp.]|nr:hypothetical protein [Nannocystis sp.]MBA3546830.1 hypothetical protein [Nannocystis sp.]
MIEVRSTTIIRGLVGITALFGLLGLGAELLRYLGGHDHAVLRLLSLSYEGNLPSWYASALPLLCAALLAVIAAGADTDRGHWRMLALGFVYISIDEAVGLHEMLGELFETTGLLRFGWVMPAAAIVLTVGLACVGFLRRLDRPTARRFVLAGALYVTGAVLFELPLGWWTEQHGADNLGYALIDWCEETLEFGGLTLFAATLLRCLHGRTLRVTAGAASR